MRQERKMEWHGVAMALCATALASIGGAQQAVRRPAVLHDPSPTLRVNIGSAGVEANGLSEAAAVSHDGRYVVYSSVATNLIPGDPVGIRDVFRFDSQTRQTVLVSADLGGLPANGPSGTTLDVSIDGRFVAFDSWADNLVAGDHNNQLDIFVRDVVLGTTERVSIDSFGVESNGPSAGATMSEDGRYVAFSSWADNLIATDVNLQQDIFLHDRTTGITRRITETPLGVGGEGTSHSPILSSNGRFVAYSTHANNLVSEPLSIYAYIFVHDTLIGETWHASVNSFGEFAHDHSDTRPGITPDGRYVVFASEAYNLAFPDLNFVSDVFLHDEQTGLTTRISEGWLGQEANGASILPSISDDGRFITFVSSADNLVPGDTNGADDVFLYDRQLDVMTCISNGALGGASNGPSMNAIVSANGRRVIYASEATDLVFGDTNGVRDIFLR